MEIEFTPEAKEELEEWRQAGRKDVLQKIRSLIESIQASPTEGIGKPERLKHNMAGLMSRRITQEDRMVYEIIDELIKIYSVKGHY